MNVVYACRVHKAIVMQLLLFTASCRQARWRSQENCRHICQELGHGFFYFHCICKFFPAVWKLNWSYF